MTWYLTCLGFKYFLLYPIVTLQGLSDWRSLNEVLLVTVDKYYKYMLQCQSNPLFSLLHLLTKLKYSSESIVYLPTGVYLRTVKIRSFTMFGYLTHSLPQIFTHNYLLPVSIHNLSLLLL